MSGEGWGKTYNRCSLAELGMKPGYWLWRNRRTGIDLQSAYLLPGVAWMFAGVPAGVVEGGRHKTRGPGRKATRGRSV